jgi:hypothetical protein
MIISHKFRYLFIEIPLTGSWAIHHELCNYYAGAPILHKHATYPEFQRIASDDEKKYFVFAAVRNPLDAAVTGFFKLKTNHKGVFSGAGTSIKSHKIDYADLINYERLRNSNATFEDCFLKPKIWERPFSDMIDVSANYLDFVMRFERLNQDFSEVLNLLGIEQVRPLPVRNKTQGRNADWTLYYTPLTIEKAKRIYGPFMKKWGYEFPTEWGDYRVPGIDQLEFRLVTMMKYIYLVYFRYNEKSYAKLVRILHSHLKNYVYR